MLDLHAARPHAPHRVGHHAHRVWRKAEHLADFANGAATPEGDHRGSQGRLGTMLFLVDPLDDLLAALVLEIDVDIGRFVTGI